MSDKRIKPVSRENPQTHQETWYEEVEPDAYQWCTTHKRPATHIFHGMGFTKPTCNPELGGILACCVVVPLNPAYTAAPPMKDVEKIEHLQISPASNEFTDFLRSLLGAQVSTHPANHLPKTPGVQPGQCSLESSNESPLAGPAKAGSTHTRPSHSLSEDGIHKSEAA
jgi:hypothetical protein